MVLKGFSYVGASLYRFCVPNAFGGREGLDLESNHIFLPTGGYWDGSSHYHVGSHGHYWSVMWSADDGWGMMFDSGALYMSGGYFRYFGLSIRAVRPLEW